MTVCFVYGTRPEIIKLAPLIKLCQEEKTKYYIINTGQHTAYNMNQQFLSDLGIIFKGFDLGVGFGSPGTQMANLMKGIEEKVILCRANCVVYQGDTNTTLAAALVCAKLGVPGINIEAGLRCGDKKALPEELNRILANQCADYLFCPVEDNAENLRKEKIQGEIFVLGNPLVDSVKYIMQKHPIPDILGRHQLTNMEYMLVTVHRKETVTEKNKLQDVLDGLKLCFEKFHKKIILPLHPTTKSMLKRHNLSVPAGVHIIDPIGYKDMLHLIKNAKVVLSDSGGVAEESAILGVPHVMLRNTTERRELLSINASFGLGTNKTTICDNALRASRSIRGWEQPYGENVSRKIFDTCKEKIFKFYEPCLDTPEQIVDSKPLKPTPVRTRQTKDMASLIIVNYNTPELTRQCIQSIKDNTTFPHEIIVIDSGSTDNSADQLRDITGIKFLETTWNKGYGGALNKGVNIAEGRYLFFLNSDLIMTKDWLAPLVEDLTSTNVAFVGPKLINQQNKIVGAGVVGTVKTPQIRGWMTDDGPDKFMKREEVVMLCGACFGCRREIFNELGRFNERIFMYFEETLIQCQALKKGMSNIYQPKSKIYHLWDKSPKGGHDTKHKWFLDSKKVYEEVLGDFANEDTIKYPRKNKLLATVIGKNEAGRFLKEALDHMSLYVDEIIFLDNGSTDNTMEVVKSYPKVVEIIQDDRDFSKQEPELRKRMLDAVQKRNPDWVIAIDCDEILENKAIREIPNLMARPIDGATIYSLRFHHFWGDRENFRTDGYWNPLSSTGPRMFRYKGQQFEFGKDGLHKGSIPPSVLRSGKIVYSGLRVKHLGYAIPTDIKQKYEYYMKNDPNPDAIHKSHYASIIQRPQLMKWVE